MEIWYRVSFGDEIEKVEVVKSTEHMLILAATNYRGKNQRTRKVSGWGSFKIEHFQTEKEAIQYLRLKLETSFARRKVALDSADMALRKFNQKYPKENNA